MSEVNRLLGRRRQKKWEDNIKMNMKEIEWGVANKIHLAQVWTTWRAVVSMSVTWLIKFG
jgi:hypothetical protein